MRLLLDTHVVIWAIGKSERLSVAARRAIEDPGNERLVSAVSAFEVAMKYRLGKLPMARRLVEDYGVGLQLFSAVELPVTSRHALTAGLFTHVHRDPFDRIIAAQSIIEGIPVVTSDRQFARFGSAVLW